MRKLSVILAFGLIVGCSTAPNFSAPSESFSSSQKNDRINCVALNPRAEHYREILDEWQNKIIIADPNSEGFYDMGGYCDLPSNKKIVSLITRRDFEAGPADGSLFLLSEDEKLEKRMPGLSIHSSDVLVCQPVFIENDILHLDCLGDDNMVNIAGLLK